MRGWWLSLILLSGTAAAAETLLPVERAQRVGPVVKHLAPPETLRPCCAFGYDLHVRAAGVPIPLYQIGNVLTLDTLGHHRYPDSALAAVKNLVGLSEEENGLIYTRRGGFIDIAHVRDTADNTFYLFAKIYPKLGQPQRLFYSEELGLRRIQLNAFTPPAGMTQRYTLAAWLAGKLGFELAQWHEIAQWYGFQSVPGFSEEISAFSPEDLYSNLLGARLAINVILQGRVGSVDDYNRALDAELQKALLGLGVATRAESEKRFRDVDGVWWNSKRRVPDKFLVLKRNYSLSDKRLPKPAPFEKAPPFELVMPDAIGGYKLSTLGELQIHQGRDMERLPMPADYYSALEFQSLADKAQAADKTQLESLQE